MDKGPPPLNDDSGEWEFPSGREFGALLKTRREEKGLTRAQVSAQIRVQAVHLEALENEDWDALPSPAFVKGFIRSYARYLGLSEEGLIALYQESAPPPQPLSRPIQTAARKSRIVVYLVLVAALLAAGVAGYHWIAPLYFEAKPPDERLALPAEKETATMPVAREERPDAESTPSSEAQRPSGPTDTGPVVARQAPEETRPGSEPSQTAAAGEEAGFLPETEKETKAEIPAPDAVQAPDGEGPPLILKASVRERTWVRVTVDDQRPKEYTFEPESSPEWRAYEGFELVIGNAGGIVFEFNGQKIEDLGKPGQVVRMKLPREEERSVSTD